MGLAPIQTATQDGLPLGLPTKSIADQGRWHSLPATSGPSPLFGHSLTALTPSLAALFGGEHPLPGRAWSSGRSSRLVFFDPNSPSAMSIASSAAVPPPRRQHAAAAVSSSELLITGGLGADGHPIGDALVATTSASLGSATWAPSGTEDHFEALLARAAHSLSALPAPPGPLFLRGPSDAAFLIFGGLASARVGALARASARGNTSRAEYAAAAAADAREPDASLVALNDVLLLSRGAHGKWRLVRLAMPTDSACDAVGQPHYAPAALVPYTSHGRGAAPRGVLPSRRRLGALQPQAWPREWPRAAEAAEAWEQEEEAWASAVRDEIGNDGIGRDGRAAAIVSPPCARSGHSAHVYAGDMHGLGSLCGGDGVGVGCLLVYAGASDGAARLDDLWLLPIDPSWARPRDMPRLAGRLAWRRLLLAHGSASPPPRAGHASALVGRHLFVLGGEAAPVGRAGLALGLGGRTPLSDALWRLDMTNLEWTCLHAAGGAPSAPRVGSGAALLVLEALYRPPARAAERAAERAADGATNASAADRKGADATDVALAGGGDDGRSAVETASSATLLLVGGQAGGESLPLWRYTVGRHTCRAEMAPLAALSPGKPAGGRTAHVGGCAFARGEQCDASRGTCVCADGSTPPCDPLSGAHLGAEPLLGEGALEQIGAAWLLVAVSALGAWLGGIGRVLVAARLGPPRKSRMLSR